MQRQHLIKERIRASIDSQFDGLVTLSERIHSHPELAWQEFLSASTVASYLDESGFFVEREYLGFETALCASTVDRDARFALGFVAEYDALPGLGHACGHHLIAAMSVGAAVATASVMRELDVQVKVIGTPAEEGGGGKIAMLERGAFEGLDIAMMAHPGPDDVVEVEPLAVSHLHIEFRGKSSHAAAFPERGINAADAMVLAQVAIGLLRQQLPAAALVHGVVVNGGKAPNAIPDRVCGRWYVRASTLAELAEIEERVLECFRAGALATGCELSVTHESGRYSEFRNDAELAGAYRKNIEQLGRRLDPHAPGVPMAKSASTDMANVSLVVPAIHPYIGLGCYPVVNHQPEFTAAGVGEAARTALRDGALALAWTAADWAMARWDRG